MYERCPDPRLAPQPADVGLPALAVETLDRDLAVEDLVLGQQHGRHAAAPGAACDPITACEEQTSGGLGWGPHREMALPGAGSCMQCVCVPNVTRPIRHLQGG